MKWREKKDTLSSKIISCFSFDILSNKNLKFLHYIDHDLKFWITIINFPIITTLIKARNEAISSVWMKVLKNERISWRMIQNIIVK